jgi:hypothetical protein
LAAHRKISLALKFSRSSIRAGRNGFIVEVDDAAHGRFPTAHNSSRVEIGNLVVEI